MRIDAHINHTCMEMLEMFRQSESQANTLTDINTSACEGGEDASLSRAAFKAVVT